VAVDDGDLVAAAGQLEEQVDPDVAVAAGHECAHGAILAQKTCPMVLACAVRDPTEEMPVPVLDTSHDLAHPVETESAWSESYYFNCYDPDGDVGFYTRAGIRPNEGTIDVGWPSGCPGAGSPTCGRSASRGR
jgi:hypothetical protein